jgi:pyridinium-3,5-biscarboxylic acid mononucleotide sulfurtransferase
MALASRLYDKSSRLADSLAMLPETLTTKYEQLKAILSSYRRVIIAFSGGLDSSFLLFAAVQVLGKENTMAAIGASESLARSEYELARKFAGELGLPGDRIIKIETKELEDPGYVQNSPDRCFFCKSELFQRLTELAERSRHEVVCDGANASDIGDHRPGMKAAKEKKVKSPLLEAGLTKEEIRQLAKSFGLTVWDKPQSACLASRIPYGSQVTKDKLRQIEEAEEFLRSLGFRQLRVRHHDTVARIELPLEDMQKVLSNGTGDRIVERFREIGFFFTTIDLGGFKSGSMNVMLKGENHD